MDWLLTIVAGCGAVLMTTLLYNRIFEHITVYDYEYGVEYYNGKLKKPVKAGRYHLRRGHSEIRKLDLRKQFLTIAGQEVLTADQVQVKVSLVLAYTIQDPNKILQLDNYQQAVHLTVQLLLREVLQPLGLDQLLQDREGLQEALKLKMVPALAEMGLDVALLAIKDLLLPGDLKRLYAQMLKVQKETQAALEKARGEQATLRSLANAARMLDKNPSLLNLRLIQTLENAQVSHTITFQPGIQPGTAATLSPSEDPAGS